MDLAAATGTLVHKAQQVLLAHREIKVSSVTPVHREIKVLLDLRVVLVLQAVKEIKVLLDLLAHREIKVSLVTPVHRVDQGVTGFTGSQGSTGFNGSAGAENATLDSVTTNGNSTTNNITTGGVQTTTLTTGSNSTAGTVTGDWILTAGSTWSATYADLAEKYTTDNEYEPGTVMKFGGTLELTQSDTANDHRVAGVVSTNPAYILNAEIEGQYLALSGRVPVKVTGSVSPGDILVSSNVPGHAEVNNDAQSGRIIGKAITADANGVCEALVTLM